jgi:hypothetical protein
MKDFAQPGLVLTRMSPKSRGQHARVLLSSPSGACWASAPSRHSTIVLFRSVVECRRLVSTFLVWRL